MVDHLRAIDVQRIRCRSQNGDHNKVSTTTKLYMKTLKSIYFFIWWDEIFKRLQNLLRSMTPNLIFSVRILIATNY